MKWPYILKTFKGKRESDSYTNGFFMFINEDKLNNVPLIKHEETHIKQMYHMWIVWAICWCIVAVITTNYWVFIAPLFGFYFHQTIYFLIRPYRLYSEVSAVKEQLKHEEVKDYGLYAEMLSSDLYDLKKTQEQIKHLLY